MDVKFYDFSKGKDFTIEVGYFDTVQEIKEKIEKYQGIPISNQTLIFNGQVMVDDRDTEFYEVLHGSHIQLQVKPESLKAVKSEESSSSSTPPPPQPQPTTTSSLGSGLGLGSSSRVHLIIKIPNLKKHFTFDMAVHDSVGNLKDKIHEAERLPMNRFSIMCNGIELNDNLRSLEDYGICNHSEIIVVLRHFSQSAIATSNNGGSSNSKRLKLMVLPKGGAQKIQVEMSASDNVGELRKELQNLQQQINFSLPSEGYFFIYKQNVMDDDRSFRWHDVRQGDTIEIFNGSVTGGS